MRHFPALALDALSLGCALVQSLGCTPAPTHGGPKSPASSICGEGAIEACEAALQSSLDGSNDISAAVDAYARARSEKDPAVEKALDALKSARSKSVVVRIGGAKVTTKLQSVDLALAPKPVSISDDVIWLALASAAKVDFLAVARPDGTVARYFPRDVLRPVMGGLVSAVADAKMPDLDSDSELERALRDAAEAARAFDYVRAADAIDRVDDLDARRDPYDPVTMRGKIFSFALGLSKPAPTTSVDNPKPNGDAPKPAPNDTPYLDLLRVRLDRHATEWPLRREHILAAFPADRRDALRAIYDPNPGCNFAVPPPLERESDLLFGSLLPRALMPSHAKATLGRLPLEAWYPRYAAFLDVSELSGAAWFTLPTLMTERGQSSGIVPSGTSTHRKAMELALRHAHALTALAEAKPGRIGVGQVAFFLAPGTLLDEPLRKEVVALAQIAARNGMSQAKDPSDVAFAALTGVLGGISMPAELREAHFTALQAAFTAKLRGEFAQRSGWGVALLFVLDGVYRTVSDQAPNLKSTAEQISRALETDPSIDQPGLAALTAAMTRYVSLAVDQGLGTPIPEGKDLLPGRAAARASLEKAIAALGDGTTPPRDLAKDVADLADETVATLALAVASDLKKTPPVEPKKADKPKKPADSCAGDATWSPDPKTRRALDKLRDLRHKIVTNKAFTSGDDLWVKRARLVVLLLSDAIDVASDWSSKAPRFAITEAEGGRYIKTAIDGWIPYPGVGDTFAASFSAYRGLTSKGKDFLTSTAGTTALRQVLSGLGLFFGSDTSGKIEGAELLTMLAPEKGKPEAELVPVLIDVSRSLYAQGKAKQADMLLLSTLVVAGVRKVPPPDAAIDLAIANHSRAAWALEFAREVGAGSRGEQMRPERFVPDLKHAVAESCGMASVDELSSVLQGIEDFRAGKRKEGRSALEAFAAQAQQKAVSLPRFSFAFQQETRTRALALTIEFGLGSGVISGANSFSVGAGAKSPGDPLLKLAVTIDGPDGKRAMDDTARFFIATSALAGVYHFLDGDKEAGEIAAARTLGAATQRTWLGVPGVTDDPLTWSADARGTVAVLAELAAENGRPLLAGDLFSLVKASLGAGADKAKVDSLLDPLPLGLVGLKDVAPLVERTKTSVKALVAGLSCIHGKDMTATYERAPCEDYPIALALRVSDSLHVLPVLTAGPKGQGGACPDLAALDGFLVPAQKQTYEPDKFIEAVTKLMEAGKTYDAAILLTKHRRPDHCSAAVTEKLSAVADRMKGAPTTRADLLSALVNCSTGAPPVELARALSALDDELLRVGDPVRSAQLALFATSLTVKTDAIEPLAAIALRPDFVDRWRHQNPEILGAALALDHAASILSGKPVRVEETAKEYNLLCADMPPKERAQLCQLVESLRGKTTPPDVRKKAARDVLSSLVSGSH